MAECNICGGNVFSATPNGRLSRRKKPPLCAKCGSLERHRIGRELASTIRIRETFKTYALLDVGRNATVPKGWFSSSREIQVGDSEIERLASNRIKFDFIVCSHVIQKLRDPRRSVRHMVNSLSDEGILLLNYPSPVTRKATEHVSGTRRTNEPLFIFGQDFEQEYKAVAPDAYVVAVESADPVTQDQDIMYLLTKSPVWATRIVKSLNSRLVH